MTPSICFLVTLCASSSRLLRVAVRIADCNAHAVDWQYPCEPEVIAVLAAHLPPHVASIGPIVEAMEIFEVVP